MIKKCLQYKLLQMYHYCPRFNNVQDTCTLEAKAIHMHVFHLEMHVFHLAFQHHAVDMLVIDGGKALFDLGCMALV